MYLHLQLCYKDLSEIHLNLTLFSHTKLNVILTLILFSEFMFFLYSLFVASSKKMFTSCLGCAEQLNVFNTKITVLFFSMSEEQEKNSPSEMSVSVEQR